MADFTPMMKQYLEIKDEYRDCILFFRLGDFYEMFFDDAKTASKELELTLTGKDCGKEERAPMCGVPFHAADSYIAKLVSRGYKVAICEQTEDPSNAKGIVKREVIRIVTPGTILDSDVLESRTNNYMCSIVKKGGEIGITFCEVSTGKMMTTEFMGETDGDKIADEMSKFAPVEIILNKEADDLSKIKWYAEKSGAFKQLLNDAFFDDDITYDTTYEQFGAKADKLSRITVCSSGAMLMYFKKTQHSKPAHIMDIEHYTSAQFMDIDWTAQKNLELFQNMQSKAKKGSLLWVLDDTKTKMGLRVLQGFIARPLLGCEKINARLDAVDELINSMESREKLRDDMKCISDMERLAGRISMGNANPRDVLALKNSFSVLPEIVNTAMNFKSPLLGRIYKNLYVFDDLCDLIERAINEDAPISVRDGRIIKKGFSEELDRLTEMRDGGAEYISRMEAEEKEKTGIKNLKIKFNKVFGYYIEVSKMYLNLVPDDYIRKQTVTNGERYINQKLKEYEGIVLGAAEKIQMLEYSLFNGIKEKIAERLTEIESTAHAVGMLDALCSLASVAVKNNYCRPVVDMSDVIDIKDGRHAVVEKVASDVLFVPNDTMLNRDKSRLAIITGPNMAGKSTYMRQTALIVIMAQMGSFVPASQCRIGITDKIFTRVGASDDLSSGQSTFMVEMSEVADILKNATEKSLLILDEIGRGTSTFDGLAIAWAVLEHCALKLKAKTLFATHYHELTELENNTDGVINYSIAVKKRGDDIIFLRKIIRGGADKSYGVEVAKLAGVPDNVIKRARVILENIENGDVIDIKTSKKETHDEISEMQIDFSSMAYSELVKDIQKIDVNTLSPIEAMNTLYDISKRAKEIG